MNYWKIKNWIRSRIHTCRSVERSCDLTFSKKSQRIIYEMGNGQRGTVRSGKDYGNRSVPVPVSSMF